MATRGRLLAVLVLAGISILVAALINASSPWFQLQAATDYVNDNLSTLIPVTALVIGSATLGNLRDDGSLVYLWLRPVPAWLHVVAAWLATLTVLVPLVGAPVMLATVMIDSSPELISGTAISVALGIVTYSALSVMIGIRFNRPLAIGLVYILIWEGFVASAGETAARLAVRGYLRSILSDRIGIDLNLAVVGPTTAVLVPVAVTVLALTYASLRLSKTDVP